MAWFVLVKDPLEARGDSTYSVHGLTNDCNAAEVWEAAGHQVIEIETMPQVSEAAYIPRG